MKGTEVFDPRSHYFVQRRRRFGFLEDWRRRRRAIARGDDVRLERSPARRAAFGFLAGGDSKVPMRVIAARILEVAPGETTSTHRHAYDAVCFVLGGQGQTEIAGERYAWSRYDTVHTPALSWHRHRNTGAEPARLLAITDAPLVSAFGLARLEDIGDEPPAPDEPLRLPVARSGTAYERELAAAAASWQERQQARRHPALAHGTLPAGPEGGPGAPLVRRPPGYPTT